MAANLAASGIDHVVTVIRHGLKQFQYRVRVHRLYFHRTSAQRISDAAVSQRMDRARQVRSRA
ncbi:hypothetical protein OG800_16350 [Streptomyces sp. NBC_00445]|uniref:hypothetical protein n=1 Tax=Streptomyces sp. NBC_00445 TaxID=2975745 RepID=UPI002E1B4528